MPNVRHTAPLCPLAFVVPAARDTPALVRGGRSTIAVRVSAHPVVRALCETGGLRRATPIVDVGTGRRLRD